MLIKYWGMYASQPWRTVIYVFRRLKIPYEHNEVRPRLDTRSADFKKIINRRGKTPVIEHNGVKMIESASIARYLLALYDKEELLIPQKDLVARQKVETMLDISKFNNTDLNLNYDFHKFCICVLIFLF